MGGIAIYGRYGYTLYDKDHTASAINRLMGLDLVLMNGMITPESQKRLVRLINQLDLDLGAMKEYGKHCAYDKLGFVTITYNPGITFIFPLGNFAELAMFQVYLMRLAHYKLQNEVVASLPHNTKRLDGNYTFMLLDDKNHVTDFCDRVIDLDVEYTKGVNGDLILTEKSMLDLTELLENLEYDLRISDTQSHVIWAKGMVEITDGTDWIPKTKQIEISCNPDLQNLIAAVLFMLYGVQITSNRQPLLSFAAKHAALQDDMRKDAYNVAESKPEEPALETDISCCAAAYKCLMG